MYGKPAAEQLVAQVQHVGGFEPDCAVAVGVAGGQVEEGDFVAVEMHAQRVVEGHYRQGHRRQRLIGGQAGAHVVVGDDGGGLAEVRIAAHMVAVVVGVEHEFGAVAAEFVNGILDAACQGQKLVIDDQYAVVADGGRDVAASPGQHVYGAADMNGFHLNAAEPIVRGERDRRARR